MLASIKAKKANFMFRVDVLEKLNGLIPDGERSQFVNNAVEEALRNYGRNKAFAMMNQMRESEIGFVSTKEILKFIKYGRL